nr:type IV secretory system conjugative DNA transfer family protein [Nitrospirales bacterium]
GKDVSIIIPNLLFYQGSILVIDSKGALYQYYGQGRRDDLLVPACREDGHLKKMAAAVCESGFKNHRTRANQSVKAQQTFIQTTLLVN